MSKLRYIIVDDEPLARKIIKELADDVDFLEMTACVESLNEAEPFLKKGSVDLIFLDIELYGTNGLTYLRENKQVPMVIVTTAYSQYALEGFELNVLDYLLKPVSPERFETAVQRAKERKDLKKSEGPDHFFVKSSGIMEKVLISQVLYIEAMANYVVIHLPEKKIITYVSFKTIEERLQNNGFMRTHRSYLVPIEKIQRIETNTVFVAGVQLPLVRTAREVLLTRVGGKIIRKE